MSTRRSIYLNFGPLYRVTKDVPCVSAPHGLLRQLFGGHFRLGSVKCVRSGGATCLLASLDGVVEVDHGLCAMISNDSNDKEDLFPSSDDEVNLLDSFNDEGFST